MSEPDNLPRQALGHRPGPDLVEQEFHNRRAIRRRVQEVLLSRTVLARDRVRDCVIVVDELIANAAKHGRPPMTLRLWCSLSHTEIQMSDSGHGFTTETSRPVRGRKHLGLSMIDELCNHVENLSDENGFHVRVHIGEHID